MKKINTEHPAYEEYYNKWETLKAEMIKKCDEAEVIEKRENPRPHLDGLTCIVHKEYDKKFSKLQKEYAFLYEDED